MNVRLLLNVLLAAGHDSKADFLFLTISWNLPCRPIFAHIWGKGNQLGKAIFFSFFQLRIYNLIMVGILVNSGLLLQVNQSYLQFFLSFACCYLLSHQPSAALHEAAGELTSSAHPLTVPLADMAFSAMLFLPLLSFFFNLMTAMYLNPWQTKARKLQIPNTGDT